MEKNLLFVQKLDTQKIKPGKGLLAFAVLWFFCFSAMAQNITITGKVTDAKDGLTIPGASVLVKATTIGTITDIDGIYNLSAPSDAILVFSFVGYESVEVAVNGRTKIDCQLSEVARDIDEVIVIGYGTQKKSDKTGAVVHITAAEMNRGVLTDPIQGLQGKAAGVMITKKGGDPNAGFSVKIRGQAGLWSGTEPLYVVDGVPGVDPTTIPSEDIESFNVLKDASSSAIYGSRAANGVILITTKKGSRLGKTGIGTGNVEYSYYISRDVVANRLELLSASQIRKYAADNNLNLSDPGGNTDWQDEVYQKGLSYSHNLAFSGASEKSNYRASVTHTNFEGVVRGTEKTRTMGRLNMETKAMDDRLNIQANLSGTVEANKYVKYDGNGGQDILYQAFQRNPVLPVYDSTGKFYEVDEFDYNNPVAIINDLQNERDAKRFLGNLKLDYSILKDLIASINLSYIRDDQENFYFEPSYTKSTTTKGKGKREYKNSGSKILETTLAYNLKVENSHNLNLIGGYSFQEDLVTGFAAEGEGPVSDYVKSNNLAMLSVVTLGDITSYKGQNRLISFFGRSVYNYNSKYYFTFTMRRDGSTKFGANKEWGWFPSASIAWNIHSEPFFENVPLISLLKLRLGWGLTGNQEIDRYLDIAKIGSQDPVPDPLTGEPTIVLGYKSNENKDLKWEENEELNIGLDFGILDNRISGTIEYYRKNTHDMLGEYSVAVPPKRYKWMYANAGEIENNGFEFSIQAFVIDLPNIEYKTSFTYSANKQEIIALGDDQYKTETRIEGYVSGRGMVGVNTQLLKPGYELGTFYGPEFYSFQDGQYIFKKTDGGYVSSAELALMPETEKELVYKVIGNAMPDFEIGWTNSVTFYKNFDLNFTFRGIFGYDVLNVTRLIFENPGVLPTQNALETSLDYADKLTAGPLYSSLYLEDGSFIRLDNVSIGYNITPKNNKWIKFFRVYFTSNNLFTITDYTGIDPEITFNGRSFGLDQYNVYPKTRTFTVGMNLKF